MCISGVGALEERRRVRDEPVQGSPGSAPRRFGEYGRAQRRIESTAVVFFFALSAVLALRVVHLRPALGEVALAALLGVVAADFFSGLVHWAGDTWGDVDCPILGPGLIRGFREHHVDPLAITGHDFVETSGSVCLGLLPVLVLALVLPPTVAALRLAVVALGCFSWSMFWTNVIHRLAHLPAPPQAAAWLQRAGVILSPDRHARHHVWPFDRSYCITTGWLNDPLDAVAFFRRLERAVTALTGAEPRR